MNASVKARVRAREQGGEFGLPASPEGRASVLSSFQLRPADLIIAGGGVMGAGILREASKAGLRVLLLDAMDFAAGSSSCSSKLVHGGLRYLQQGQPGVTFRSVRERESLLRELPGLIEPLEFLLPVFSWHDRALFKLGLTVYDAFAGRFAHRWVNHSRLELSAPGIRDGRLQGGYGFADAQTDDARLVMRLLHDAVAAGGRAINYVRVVRTVHSAGKVTGVVVRDVLTGREWPLPCGIVVNATGWGVDELRRSAGLAPVVRPLRGSHLVFSRERLPVEKAVAFAHPRDHRNVFLIPWAGVTFIGTTDLDHAGDPAQLPRISGDERAYLLAAVQFLFPHAGIDASDIVSTWSGVRPVIRHPGHLLGGRSVDPSREARDMFIHLDNGLLTVTGGKLTTFRHEAVHALRLLGDRFPRLRHLQAAPFAVADLPDLPDFTQRERAFLAGACTPVLPELVSFWRRGESPFLRGTRISRMVLRFALKREAVVHLDDLLLRRTRLGLVMPRGAARLLPDVRRLCREAGWSAARMQQEESRYLEMIRTDYS